MTFDPQSRSAAESRTEGNAGSGNYTAEEAASIRKEGKTFRNIVAGVDMSVSDFFRKWRGGRKSHEGEKLEKLYIAHLPANVADRVSDIVGYDVGSRDFVVTNDDVKHVIDTHGDPNAEIAKGNIPLESWMLDALSDVLTAPDSIEAGHEGTGKKNAGKTGLVFSKSFPDGKVVTIQFDNKGRGTLELGTMYAKESATLKEDNAFASPAFTPEATKPALSVADTTVPQGAADVNVRVCVFRQGFRASVYTKRKGSQDTVRDAQRSNEHCPRD